jgi:hypothetical protein
MTEQQLAYMVRDNAIHGWRTAYEIADDEGMTVEEVIAACEKHLYTGDMDEIRAFTRCAA